MRGQHQIAAAARDDRETANRNGMKAHWRREKLGTLLDKLDEEIKEFKEAVDKGDREGMKLEGSDLRWCVTMIQDHEAALELSSSLAEPKMLDEEVSGE